jgi:molybdopterin converting factor small subunit
MSVRVLFFARSRELMGRSAQEVQLDDVAKHTAATAAASADSAAAAAPPAPSVRSLLAFLLHSHPQLSSLLPTSLFALNQEFVAADSDAPLRQGDELAFIQPISGG